MGLPTISLAGNRYETNAPGGHTQLLSRTIRRELQQVSLGVRTRPQQGRPCFLEGKPNLTATDGSIAKGNCLKPKPGFSQYRGEIYLFLMTLVRICIAALPESDSCL
jgi:hypothetical protein